MFDCSLNSYCNYCDFVFFSRKQNVLSFITNCIVQIRFQFYHICLKQNTESTFLKKKAISHHFWATKKTQLIFSVLVIKQSEVLTRDGFFFFHFFSLINSFRCWSKMGRTGGAQLLSLGSGCEYVGVVMHELMHSIGRCNPH